MAGRWLMCAALSLFGATAQAQTLRLAQDDCLKISERAVELECLVLVSEDRNGCTRTKNKKACEILVKYLHPASQYSRCDAVKAAGGDEVWCNALFRRRLTDCDDQGWAAEADCKHAVRAMEKFDLMKAAQAQASTSPPPPPKDPPPVLSSSSTVPSTSSSETPPTLSLSEQLAQQRGQLREVEPEEATDGYRRTFSSMSMGTEQELTGVVAVISPKLRGKLGVVKFDGTVIMDITTDMQIGQHEGTEKYAYTIELITHPTEVSSEDEWEARKSAFKTVVALIDRKGLVTGRVDELDIEIFPAVAEDLELVGTKVSSSGKQATVGVPTSDIGTGSEAGQLIAAAPWFDVSRGEVLPSSLREEAKARQVYAYLASVLTKLTWISEEFGALGVAGKRALGLTDPEVKNSWVILPRTAPVDMLKLLASEDKVVVTRQLRTDAVSEHGKAALDYLLSGQALAGHANISDATIDGKPSMLFEFRDATQIPPSLAAKFGLTGDEASAEEIRAEGLTDKTEIEEAQSGKKSLLDAIRSRGGQ